MIRQVDISTWNAIIASKGSIQNQDIFLREFNSFRDDWAKRKQILANEYKSDLTNADYLAAKTILQTEAETQLIQFGFYEEVSQIDLDDNIHDNIILAVKNHPALILRIMTSITNYYRSLLNKSKLTEYQVKTRLLE